MNGQKLSENFEKFLITMAIVPIVSNTQVMCSGSRFYVKTVSEIATIFYSYSETCEKLTEFPEVYEELDSSNLRTTYLITWPLINLFDTSFPYRIVYTYPLLYIAAHEYWTIMTQVNLL